MIYFMYYNLGLLKGEPSSFFTYLNKIKLEGSPVIIFLDALSVRRGGRLLHLRGLVLHLLQVCPLLADLAAFPAEYSFLQQWRE